MLESIRIYEHATETSPEGNIIVSIAEIDHDHTVSFIVGHVGFPSVERRGRVGTAVLFETLEGLFEVRIMRTVERSTLGSAMAFVQVARVTPTGGVTAGFVESHDAGNTAFSDQEIAQIATSLNHVREAASGREDLRPEQFGLVSRKLDDMAKAADHLGRRDWVNLAVGTLTNLVVNAALGSEPAKFLFRTLVDGRIARWPLETFPDESREPTPTRALFTRANTQWREARIGERLTKRCSRQAARNENSHLSVRFARLAAER